MDGVPEALLRKVNPEGHTKTTRQNAKPGKKAKETESPGRPATPTPNAPSAPTPKATEPRAVPSVQTPLTGSFKPQGLHGDGSPAQVVDNSPSMTFTIIVAILGVVVLWWLLGVLLRVFGRKQRSVRRHTALLVGLCGSGKTAMFSQLVEHRLVDTRTSMQQNRSKLNLSGVASSDSQGIGSKTPTVVDFPGHRRLREGLLLQVLEAEIVIVSVDSVTIHDDRYDGAQALAELVVSLFSSPEFSGVKRVLFACTKRDEITSYSSKAVKKLLEAEVGRQLKSLRGNMASIDSVKSADGTVTTKSESAGGAARGGKHGRGVIPTELTSGDRFTFDTFCSIPVTFSDVSSFVDVERTEQSGQVVDPSTGKAVEAHNFNLSPVFAFISQ